MNNVKDNYKLMFTTYPDVVTVRELKDMLGIGITLAYRLVKSNNIENIKYQKQMSYLI